MKKIIALVLSCIFILSMSLPAYATESATDIVGISGNESAIVPFAATKPTSSHSLPYAMTITNLTEQHSTYSRYYFAPGSTESLTISGNLWPSGTEDGVARNVKILLFQVQNDNIIDSYTVNGITEKQFIAHTFTGLDTDSHYYFRIDNMNSHPPYANRYVSGSITVI